MAYLRLLRQSDLRTIQNSYLELFQLQAPSRRALEDALASRRWLSLAAVSPDLSSPSREEYMGGFVMSVVATVADFRSDLNYYTNGDGDGGGAPQEADETGGGTRVGVQATGLERVGLPLEQRAVNICMLGVLPSYRRRGLARLLLRQVVDSARTASACAVFLHVRPSNTAALALYQSAGFVPTALLPDYYDAGSVVGAAGGMYDSTLADTGTAAELTPRTAGGDAVLLVMPLTEVAAAAVAAAAEVAKEAVEAAVAAAAARGGPSAAIAVASSVARGSSQGPPGTAERTGTSAAAAAAATAATSGGPFAAASPSRPGGRFTGRGAPLDTNGVDNSTTATTNGTTAGGSSGGRGGKRAGLFGLVAAAAAGAVDGLSVLLPGRGRPGGQQAGGKGSARELRVGNEVLMEERGPDGEVYLCGSGGEAGSSADGVAGATAGLSSATTVTELTTTTTTTTSSNGVAASSAATGSIGGDEDGGGRSGGAAAAAHEGEAPPGGAVTGPSGTGSADVAEGTAQHPHTTCRALAGVGSGVRRAVGPAATAAGAAARGPRPAVLGGRMGSGHWGPGGRERAGRPLLQGLGGSTPQRVEQQRTRTRGCAVRGVDARGTGGLRNAIGVAAGRQSVLRQAIL